MLDHIAGKRNRQVVAKSLLGRKIRLLAAVLNPEEEFVALFTIFAQQRAEVLHGRGFNTLISIFDKNRLDRVENVVAADHFSGAEISRAFRN